MPQLDRTVVIRGKDRVIRHKWLTTGAAGVLRLTSTLLKEGTTKAAGKGLQANVPSVELLADKCREHATDIENRAGKRGKQNTPAAAAAAATGKRSGADARLSQSDPIATELFGGLRRSTRSEAAPPKRPKLSEDELQQQADEERRADVLRMLGNDPVLAEEVRKLLGAPDPRSVAAVHAENTRALSCSLEALEKNCKTNIGRIAYNTALAAAAGAGEHTCSPDDPCEPAARCPPAQTKSGVSLVQRAESLGVREKTFREARARMHHVDHSLAPSDALEQGRYCWAPRKTRSAKTDDRVLALAYRYWHSDDVSRGCGDSGTKNMWRASKKMGEEYHSKRELMVSGDEAFRMFLRWPQYLVLKKDLLQEDSTFQDPGRTTFLSTRCGCLVEPKASQCACQIHTQQKHYLDSLGFLIGAVHNDCDCTCDWCDGAGCQKWGDICKNIHSFSDALACGKKNLLEGDSSGGFEHWARKPECAAGTCEECGFGKPNGIPKVCQAMEKHSDRLVGWLKFGDQTMEDGTVHKKQQIPQTGKLGTLWKEFMAHSLLYMQHHELAKWQHQAHNMNMATFLHGTVLVETDFIEKYKHDPANVMTCQTSPSTTMMVALVHHSPDGNGHHTTDAWTFLSEDKNHDFDFHEYAMGIIAKYYTEGEGRAATTVVSVPIFWVWTDGCGKQYKGKRNFHAVSESLHRLGVVVVHNFAVTSHFKGAHDGIGGLLKTLMREAETRGLRIHDTAAAHKFFSEYAEGKANDEGGVVGKWSPYKIARFMMEFIGPKEIPRPPITLTGIPGSAKLYQFMGLEQQKERRGVSVGVGMHTVDEVGDVQVGDVGGQVELACNPTSFRGADVWHTFPAPEKFKETYTCRVRKASCFRSKCRIGAYLECKVASTYPDQVGVVETRSGARKADLVSVQNQKEEGEVLQYDPLVFNMTPGGVQKFVAT